VSIYHIQNWDAFENSKSRTYEKTRYVCMPNKQDGMGLMRILTQPDGAAIFGIWCLILQACSRQGKHRDGWLTVDGKPMSEPWPIEDLAIRWHRPVAEIERALAYLCSPKIKWMECLHDARIPDGYRADTERIPDGYHGTLERKEGEKGEERTESPCDVFERDKPTAPPTQEQRDKIASLEWKATLEREGYDIPPWNATKWSGLISRHGIPFLVEIASQIAPEDRGNPGKVEAIVIREKRRRSDTQTMEREAERLRSGREAPDEARARDESARLPLQRIASLLDNDMSEHGEAIRAKVLGDSMLKDWAKTLGKDRPTWLKLQQFVKRVPELASVADPKPTEVPA
jgi:hypothetical protein